MNVSTVGGGRRRPAPSGRGVPIRTEPERPDVPRPVSASGRRDGDDGGSTAESYVRRLAAHPLVPRSRSHARLSDEVAVARAEVVEDAARAARRGADASWADAVLGLLDEAQHALDANRVQRGWATLLAAQRLRVFGLAAEGPDALRAEADVTERLAAEKLSSWRLEAVERLLAPLDADAEWSPRERARRAASRARRREVERRHAARLYRAKSIVDGEFTNTAIKRRAFRRQLGLLIAVASVALVAFFAARAAGGEAFAAGTVLDSGPFGVAVVSFGVLGAATSGFLRAIRASGDERIPDQARGYAVAVSRTAVGGVSALVGVVFLQSGLLQPGASAAGTALAFAFAAGFSEGLVERAATALAR